jgi:hypothetical protein
LQKQQVAPSLTVYVDSRLESELSYFKIPADFNRAVGIDRQATPGYKRLALAEWVPLTLKVYRGQAVADMFTYALASQLYQLTYPKLSLEDRLLAREKVLVSTGKVGINPHTLEPFLEAPDTNIQLPKVAGRSKFHLPPSVQGAIAKANAFDLGFDLAAYVQLSLRYKDVTESQTSERLWSELEIELSYFGETFLLTKATTDGEALEVFKAVSGRIKDLFERLQANRGEDVSQLCRLSFASVTLISMKTQLPEEIRSELLEIIRLSSTKLGLNPDEVASFLDSPLERFEAFRATVKAVVRF